MSLWIYLVLKVFQINLKLLHLLAVSLLHILERINLLLGATNLTHEEGKLIFQVKMTLTMEMKILM